MSYLVPIMGPLLTLFLAMLDLYLAVLDLAVLDLALDLRSDEPWDRS